METIFGGPLNAVSEGVICGEFWESLRKSIREIVWGAGVAKCTEVRVVGNWFL